MVGENRGERGRRKGNFFNTRIFNYEVPEWPIHDIRNYAEPLTMGVAEARATEHYGLGGEG